MMVVIRPKRKKNDDRGATISSEIHTANSEKLTLSRKQFFPRRKKTLAALGPIHTKSCAQAKVKLLRENKLKQVHLTANLAKH